MKRKVAVMFGGRSLEREISIITAMQVLNNIDKSKYIVEAVYACDGNFYMEKLDDVKRFVEFNPTEHKRVFLINGEFCVFKRKRAIGYFKPDVAFLCFHGGEGEDGRIQALLDFNGIAYTSCDCLRSALCMDKTFSKMVFENAGYNVLPYTVVDSSDFEKDVGKVFLQIESKLNYPLIVKPSNQGSSIGIGTANNRDELEYALSVACKFDDKAIVEKKLCDFKEVNCACFSKNGAVVISQTEQPFSANDFLTFEDKYIDGGKMSAGAHKMPADIGEAENCVRSLAERIYKEIGLFGVVRIDFLLDGEDKIYINEVNTIPGSMAYYLFEGVGISFEKLIDCLIDEGIDRKKGKRNVEFKTNVLSGFIGGSKLKK